MDFGFFSDIAKGLRENPAATVAALAIVAMVVQFRVLMAQHRAQLSDRDEHQADMDKVQEARVQDAQKVVAVLEGVRMSVMILERTIDTLGELTDIHRGQKTVVRRRPGFEEPP